MLHKTIKAAATATDEGKFTAIAACYTVDRMDEKILPGAFAKTISHWQSSGKMLPLHWDHEGDPESIIGRVDPKSMREAEEGLYVRGQLDIEQNEKARAAWRAMKNNSIGLSFGYLVKDDETIEDIKHLKEIDLFEISITPAPVNPDTRIVSMKSTNAGTEAKVTVTPVGAVVDAGDQARELSEEAAAEVRKGYDDLEIGLLAVGVNPEAKAVEETKLDAGETPDEEQQIEDAREEEPPEANSEAQDPLRKAYDDLAVELTTRGISLAEPPKVEEKPKEDPIPMRDLRKHSYDLLLETLIGSRRSNE